MFVTYDQIWADQRSSWWAKANRAKEHIDSLRHQVSMFQAGEPYSLTPEPTEKPGRLAYRLRFHTPIPVAISTTVGDVLHNLRSALESLAFEAARISHGGTLTPAQERDSKFPICKSPADFDKFVRSKRELYDDRSFKAFRSVQPFVNLEEAHRIGVALDRRFEEEFKWSELHRLNITWNIDKHRRLSLMTWWPNLIYWSSDGESNRQAFPGDGTLANGSILLYIEGADEGQGDRISNEFVLILSDDPAFSRNDGAREDVLNLLESWYKHIVHYVIFPRMFTIMSQAADE